jgi:hypothetical protein
VKPLVVAIYAAPGFKDPYSEILWPFGCFSPLCLGWHTRSNKIVDREVETVELSNHKRHDIMLLYI